MTAKKGDVFDKPGLVQLLKGHDAVISAVHFSASDPKLLIEAVKEAGVKRYFVVGGAGSLEVAPGVKLIDTPQFPAEYKAEASKGGEFLELLRKDKDLDWTFLSPSAVIAPGERTGKFRLGKDQLLTHDKGSNISWEDYADRRRRRTREAGPHPRTIHRRVLSRAAGQGRAPALACHPIVTPPPYPLPSPPSLRRAFRSGRRRHSHRRARLRAPADARECDARPV